MFEKFNQIAQHAAASASRRQFLGRIGRGAVVAAAGVASFLAFGSEAQAGKRVCGTDSVLQCAGQPVGSLCGTRERPGRCVGAPHCRCRLFH